MTGPDGKCGFARAALQHIAFHAIEGSPSIKKCGILATFAMGAIVGGEDDQRIIGDVKVAECLDNVANHLVEVRRFFRGCRAGARILVQHAHIAITKVIGKNENDVGFRDSVLAGIAVGER